MKSITNKIEWEQGEDLLEVGEEYVVACYTDEDIKVFHVATWHEKGDIIGYKVPKSENHFIEDVILTDKNAIYAEKEGFYIYSDKKERLIFLQDTVDYFCKLED